MTAFSTFSPRNASASRLIFWRRNAESCWAVYSLPWSRYFLSVPIFRLNAVTVPSGFETAWRRAGSPTRSWPSLVNATYDGNALPPPTVVPSALGMMAGRPPSRTAAAELLVPRSIPMIFDMLCSATRTPAVQTERPGRRCHRLSGCSALL